MVNYTRRKRVNNRKTKQRGGLTNAQKAAMASLGSALKGGPSLSTNPKQTPVPTQANDPLAKYRKMLKIGQPEAAVIQKMLTNGKNPKNLFPEYGLSNTSDGKAPVVGFTLDELRELKDYVNRSEIVVRLNKLDIDPREIYPELTGDEIVAIIEDYSKPRDVPAPVVTKTASGNSGAPTKSMKNALFKALKGRVVVNSKKQNISFFIEYTPQEKTDLSTIDSYNSRINEIESIALPLAKKSIKQAEEKGQQLKDFQLKKILSLLKEKRDLETLILRLNTDKLKNKVNFVRGEIKFMNFSEDKKGPLPNGWFAQVNSENNTIVYVNKYSDLELIDRPTKPELPPELPAGWIMKENDEAAWYINTLTNKSQYKIPTEPAQLFNTTGWTPVPEPDGSYTWYMQYNKNNSGEWFVRRNADSIWYENPSNGSGVRYNEPPF
jgi:hypothetical protein